MGRLERIHRWWNRVGLFHIHRWNWVGGTILSDGQGNFLIRTWCKDCPKERV